MKSLTVKLGIILFVILVTVFSCAKEQKDGWNIYASNNLGNFYYHIKSIERPSQNIVRVWVKEIYTEIGEIWMIGLLGSYFAKLSHRIALLEINCVDKQYCYVIDVYLSKDGNVLGSESYRERKWESISEGKILEVENLYKAVCK